MVADTPCPDDTALRALVLGLPDAATDLGLEAHFASCPRCVQRAAATFESDDHLVLAIQHAGVGPVVEVPAEVLDRLRQLRPEAVAVDTAPHEQRVGPYRLECELGRGGMGVVYLARHDRLDRPVAIKMLPHEASAVRLERFRIEAMAIALLRHPGIIQIHEVGEADSRPFLVLEYADGGTLAQRLNDSPLSSPEAAAMLEPVARAVGFAHSVGVLHRDLKPSNILLGADGAPKVGDFGLVKRLDLSEHGPTETGALVGTPGYMAPEQAGGGDVGLTADVYGLGAVLYECLTGRPPFRAATPLATLDQLRSRDPVPPSRLEPSVPRDLETVCLKCLEKSPARRYPTAEALADDLGRFLRGEPVIARPAGPARRTWKWARRRPTVAALLVVSVLAVITLVAGVMFHNARLQQAAKEADRQRDQAATNYRVARDALRRVLHRLDDRHASSIPGLRELQRDQLEDALVFYQGVLASADDPRPAVQLDAALAQVEAATIQYILGRTDDARVGFRRAEATLDALPGEYRDGTDCRLGLIVCFNHLAHLSGDASEEAAAWFQKGMAEAVAMLRDAPDSPNARNAVAQGEHNLAMHNQLRQQNDQAVKGYQRAIALRSELLSHPDAPKSTATDLAGDLANLGLLYVQTSKNEMAADAFRRAEGLLQPSVGPSAPDLERELALAAVYVNWGNLLRFSGNVTGGIAKFSQAVRVANAVLLREPNYGTARERAVQAHGARAYALLHGGRAAAAVEDFDRVIELTATAVERVPHRVGRAVALARSGQQIRAATEAHALASAPNLSGDDRYYLATVLALAVRSTLARPVGGGLAAVALAEVHATAGLRLLHQLAAEGYFRTVDTAKYLLLDDDLSGLRGRPAFRHLVDALPAISKLQAP